MATIVTEKKVCDMCGSEEGVESYSIATTGRPKHIDLCEKHRGPVDKILAKAKPAPQPRRRPVGELPVTTMEELERLKRRK